MFLCVSAEKRREKKRINRDIERNREKWGGCEKIDKCKEKENVGEKDR